MSDVYVQKKLSLSIPYGAFHQDIEFAIYADGEFEMLLRKEIHFKEDSVEVEPRTFETQRLPIEVALRLRDFLNYAYPTLHPIGGGE